MKQDYNVETLFPLSLAEETISILRERNATFVTYDELKVPRLFPARMAALDYFLEYLRFKAAGTRNPLRWTWRALSAGLRYRGPRFVRSLIPDPASGSLSVILQHDADRQPYKTLDMMRMEERQGVRSSNYFFRERNMWDDDREPYDPDVSELQRLEAVGFEIGYHLNAYELAGYDRAKYRELLERDLAWFLERFNLRTFVPHGGLKGAGGIGNDFVPYEGPLKALLWCYNGRGRHGICKDVTWSDGHVSFAAPRDPREVAAAARPGQRLLFLMHPQYYGTRLMKGWEKFGVSSAPWWRKLWNLDGAE